MMLAVWAAAMTGLRNKTCRLNINAPSKPSEACGRGRMEFGEVGVKSTRSIVLVPISSFMA